MALGKYGTGIDPLQGIDEGTVFQRGKYGAVIKNKSYNQGQLLRPNLDAQEAIGNASRLWNNLSPADQATWASESVNFPTEDRYGNPRLSTGRQLFLRTIGRYPLSLQVPLITPRPPYTGSAVSPGSVVWDGTTLTYTPPPVPVGEVFSISLFASYPVGLGLSSDPGYFRRILFTANYTGSPVIDITAQYFNVFGRSIGNDCAFFREEIYNSATPEVLSDSTFKVCFPQPIPYILDTLSIRTSVCYALQQLTSQAGPYGVRMRVNSTFYDVAWVNDEINANSPLFFASTGLPSGLVLGNLSTASNNTRLDRWYNQIDGGLTYLDWAGSGFMRPVSGGWSTTQNIQIFGNAAQVAFSNAANEPSPLFPCTFYGYNRPGPINNFSYYVRNFSPISPYLFQRFPRNQRFMNNGSSLTFSARRSSYAREMAVFDGVNSEYYLNNVLDVSGNTGSSSGFTRLGVGYFARFGFEMVLDGVPSAADRNDLDAFMSTIYP